MHGDQRGCMDLVMSCDEAILCVEFYIGGKA